MKRIARLTQPALVSVLALAPAAVLADVEIAEVHQQSCTECHGTDVYTRDDRKVTSYDGLARQVRRCETALGLRWFDDEIDAMTAHLNREYYRFMPDQ